MMISYPKKTGRTTCRTKKMIQKKWKKSIEKRITNKPQKMKKENEKVNNDSNMNPMNDTVKYSAGNEGDSIADDNNNITPEETALLNAAGEDDEERELHNAELDSTDDDEEALNE